MWKMREEEKKWKKNCHMNRSKWKMNLHIIAHPKNNGNKMLHFSISLFFSPPKTAIIFSVVEKLIHAEFLCCAHHKKLRHYEKLKLLFNFKRIKTIKKYTHTHRHTAIQILENEVKKDKGKRRTKIAINSFWRKKKSGSRACKAVYFKIDLIFRLL